MTTAHLLLAHPDAPTEKVSVQHERREEVEIGMAAAVLAYSRKHGVPMAEVATKVTWAS